MTNEEAIEWLNTDDYHSAGYNKALDMAIQALLRTDVPDRNVGEWIVVKRHEHYPSGKPYEQLQCPFCKRFDNNGDGSFCGYCGARMMKGEEDENNNQI